MSAQLRLLVVGGYGTFGSRTIGLLKDEPRLHIIVAGRSHGKAETFCAAQEAAAVLQPAAFDRAATGRR
ncbi:hypothetical protein [Chelatococcus reniformis]|uniref:Saccharopine dehydrogenase NADP binding domain-containing protein n=1 Tax=Chelatococcus reniformis TaxID=1494448 RepID=A0A916TXK0_9HYPH|nr:hypothetical protein [Chelatococcus reniformis]GGC45118.1 hypothetical protein GCM10010994_00330 [Chelatococcus reniformis]